MRVYVVKELGGANLACMSRMKAADFETFNSSTLGTSQNDSAVLDFGIVTNTGEITL